MATRGREPIEFIWVLLDIAGLDLAAVRDRVRTKLRSDPRLANVEVGVNLNSDRTRAVVKVNADQAWLDALPLAIRSRIERVYTAADHVAAVALVTDPAWSGVAE